MTFDKTISAADATKISIRGTFTDTITGGTGRKAIRVTKATVSGNSVKLRTNIQVPKGATISFNTGSITASDGPFTGSTKTLKAWVAIVSPSPCGSFAFVMRPSSAKTASPAA